MKSPLFNAAFFEKNAEPWPAQVFQKKFDATFFIEFPHVRYANEPIEIFDFLNNLQDPTLFLATPDGRKKAQFEHKSTYFESFFIDFQRDWISERFLFWHGETDIWAMVSDATRGFAVIGIDWKLADQVPLFYKNFLFSYRKIAELLGDLSLEKMLATNYAPAKILTEGGAENPIWVKYFFQSKVEKEGDKLFYWPQFEAFFEAIAGTLTDFKSQFMWADQHFSRRFWRNKQLCGSNKMAPVGGWQKFSHKNCERVATKFLSQNTHLALAFEGQNDESTKLYVAAKQGLIEFVYLWIYASLEKKQKVEGEMDFYCQFAFYDFSNKMADINQNFQLFYQKSAISTEKMDDLLTKLTQISFAKNIIRLEQPAIFWKINELGIPEIQRYYSVGL